MDKYIFRNAILRETNQIYRDSYRPHDLVMVKNKAVKLLDSLEENDKFTFWDRLLGRKRKKINHLRNMLIKKGGLTVVRQPRINDCDVEIIQYGSNLHYERKKSETYEMDEVTLVLKTNIQSDTIKKFSVTETGDLVEYQENIK